MGVLTRGIQLCIRVEGDQYEKPAIVFRVKGNMSSAEKAQFHQDVDVYFETSAWMDSHLNQEWVKRKSNICLQYWISTREGFHEMSRKEINAIIYLLPENHTDKVQRIDAGFESKYWRSNGEMA